MTGNPSRMPPHNLDAEAAVLSAVLAKPDALFEANAYLGDEDWYSVPNREIWQAIVALERESSPYDVVTVAHRLNSAGALQRVGGTPYLTQITDATPAIANVGEHARIVAGLAQQRRLIAFFQVATAEAYTPLDDPFAWGQELEAKLYEQVNIGRRADDDGALAVVMPRVVEGVLERAEGKGEPPGIMTGFHDLDDRFNGLKRGKSYLVAGRPGMGKTAFISQLGTNIARQHLLVVEICTEQSREELALRKLSQATAFPFHVLESPKKRSKLSRHELDMVVSQGRELAQLPLAVEYLVQPTIGVIRSAIRRALAKLRRRFGNLPLGLISLDQFQHFDGQPQKGQSREEVAANMSREIAGMAGHFWCPVVCACQLNRQVEGRPDKRPNLSDLRDTGAMEADAYGVILPFRPRYYEKAERGQPNDPGVEDAELILAKHKNGPAGSVALSFDPPSMTFENVGESRHAVQEHLPL